MLRVAAAALVAVGAAAAAAPAADQMFTIAPGVRILGTPVGGMTSLEVREELQHALERPLEVVYRGEAVLVSPQRFRTRAGIDRAVRAALQAPPDSRVGLRIVASEQAVASYVGQLGRRFDRSPREAEIVGATAAGPRIRTGRAGLAVDRARMRRMLTQRLRSGSRKPIVLAMRPVAPARTVVDFGPIVVIDRSRNTLKLYEGKELVRSFGVATGTSAHPTPQGIFRVVDMQRNPWWFPPNSPWARGQKPVPPGPGNPLGTRWMGISSPAVGIHGTPDSASIGYSRSHGCIRMRISEAEWLFTNVDVGTPVVIL